MTRITAVKCLLGSSKVKGQVYSLYTNQQVRFQIVEGLKSCSDT